MDEMMIRHAAQALAARLRTRLDDDFTASTITLSRDEAVLAQGFAEGVANLLAPRCIATGDPTHSI